jgi:hypothetical protein
MTLKPGARMRGVADSTEVVVVRAPSGDVDLRCGGHPMVAIGGDSGDTQPLDPDFAGGTQLGKRYVDDASGIELLCTKPGEGSLSVGAEILLIKEAKPLPSSD